ncbi:MFS transporter [Leptolyngbya ohadii]|uniref:MFS transporter n=1 Tax=Leptolyngbya ohadii TaxID=1962290 RepID=UPI000B59A971|nr:MFS transporter [Leptolyngbya ohadii]
MAAQISNAFAALRHARPVWVQAIGRLLYQTSYTAMQFYTPLLFVNQMGLSATTVGIALGTGSLAGVVGHLLGGYLADSPNYGRKRALLFAAILSIVAALLLAVTPTFPMLIFANLLLGLSAGCYWTAADAAVVDVTLPEQRQSAFSLLVFADTVGSGLGVWAGGLIAQQIQWLFGFSAVPIALFLLVIQFAVSDRQEFHAESDPFTGFGIALRDQSLLLFVLVNILFTTYVALVSSTLPLYLTRLGTGSGQTVGSVAQLFTWVYIGLGAVLQIPIVQFIRGWNKPRALLLSMALWGIGFLLVWLTAVVSIPRSMTIAALAVLSIAGVIYKPFAPAIVAEFAPVSLRGVYLAISYQCWSIGYFLGPIVGGWAMDQPFAQQSWLWGAGTTLFGLVGLQRLAQRSLQTVEPLGNLAEQSQAKT